MMAFRRMVVYAAFAERLLYAGGMYPRFGDDVRMGV